MVLKRSEIAKGIQRFGEEVKGGKIVENDDDDIHFKNVMGDFNFVCCQSLKVQIYFSDIG